MSDRHVDHDLEAMIAGHVLARAGAIGDVLAHCRIDDFNSDVFARIIESAQAISEEGYAPSPILVRPRLSGETVRYLEARFGMPALDFLGTLAKRATPFESVIALAKRLSDLAMRRRIDAELEAARERLADYAKPATEAISGAMEVGAEAAQAALRARGDLSNDEAAQAMMREMQDAMAGKPIPAVPTGLKRLDQLIGGFQPGDFGVIAGRPGMGKSLLLSNVCRAACQADKPAIMFSLEMPKRQVLQRLTTDLEYDTKNALQAPIAYSKMRSGKIQADEFDRLYSASRQIASLPLKICDLPALTVQEIGALAESYARNKPLGIIAIDYLQIVRAGERYRGSRVNEVSEITASLKALALRIGWPVIAGCQLSRATEATNDKKPTLSSLRESGSIEQDADIVLGLFRPAYYIEQRRPSLGQIDPEWAQWKADWTEKKNDLEIDILKNRNGPTTPIMAHIEIRSGSIRNRQEETQPNLSEGLVDA